MDVSATIDAVTTVGVSTAADVSIIRPLLSIYSSSRWCLSGRQGTAVCSFLRVLPLSSHLDCQV